MIRIFWAFLVLVPAVSEAGIFSLEHEQRCTNGRCYTVPTLGPASCVAVAHTRSGGSIVLTAAHCVSANMFVVSPAGRYRATLVTQNRQCDIAALYVDRSVTLTPITDPPAVGSPVRLMGTLTRRFQESGGSLARIEPHRCTITGAWSHPGMSGGAVVDAQGSLFAIWHSKSMNGREGYATGPDCLRRALSECERIHGSLQYEPFREPVSRQPPIPRPKPSGPEPAPTTDCAAILDRIEQRLQALEQRPCISSADLKSEVNVAVTLAQSKLTQDHSEKLAAISKELALLRQWKRRVLLVDGTTRAVLDDESYSADEPIVLDIRTLQVKQK